jgi:hypothetical protein
LGGKEMSDITKELLMELLMAIGIFVSFVVIVLTAYNKI